MIKIQSQQMLKYISSTVRFSCCLQKYREVHKGTAYMQRIYVKIIVGNKATIGLILPDDEMPMIEEGPFKGLRAEAICNPLGKH